MALRNYGPAGLAAFLLACSSPGASERACTSAKDCDDSNECTADVCVQGQEGHGSCQNPPQREDESCQQGGGRCVSGTCCSGCRTGDQCLSGATVEACGQHGAACVSCDDTNRCTEDRCTEGQCVHDPLDRQKTISDQVSSAPEWWDYSATYGGGSFFVAAKLADGSIHLFQLDQKGNRQRDVVVAQSGSSPLVGWGTTSGLILWHGEGSAAATFQQDGALSPLSRFPWGVFSDGMTALTWTGSEWGILRTLPNEGWQFVLDRVSADGTTGLASDRLPRDTLYAYEGFQFGWTGSAYGIVSTWCGPGGGLRWYLADPQGTVSAGVNLEQGCDFFGRRSGAAMAISADGFALAWPTYSSTPNGHYDCSFRRYDLAGAPLAERLETPGCDGDHPSLASNKVGYALSWSDTSFDGPRTVRAMVLDQKGKVLRSPYDISSTAEGAGGFTTLLSTPDSFAALWHESAGGTGTLRFRTICW